MGEPTKEKAKVECTSGSKKLTHNAASKEFLMRTCLYVWGLLPLFISLWNDVADGLHVNVSCSCVYVCVREPSIVMKKRECLVWSIFFYKDIQNYSNGMIFFFCNPSVANFKLYHCCLKYHNNNTNISYTVCKLTLELMTIFTCTH